jgi:serine/threonine protein kinase
VYAAVDRLTGERVAIKRIHGLFRNISDALRVLREITLLRLLSGDPYIVRAKAVLLPPSDAFSELYIVFELMESDLRNVISINDDLTAGHHRIILYQMLRGLAFMHGAGVLHRDLKPNNVLTNSNCAVKLCDLGLARPANGGGGTSGVAMTDYVATRWYRAPELCGCFYGVYTAAVDVWSLGCIFAETVLRRPLFPGRSVVDQLTLITDMLGRPSDLVIDGIANKRARRFLRGIPPKSTVPLAEMMRGFCDDPLAIELLGRMIAFDPSERPSAADALRHPYFNGLPLRTAGDDAAAAVAGDAVRTQLAPVEAAAASASADAVAAAKADAAHKTGHACGHVSAAYTHVRAKCHPDEHDVRALIRAEAVAWGGGTLCASVG